MTFSFLIFDFCPRISFVYELFFVHELHELTRIILVHDNLLGFGNLIGLLSCPRIIFLSTNYFFVHELHELTRIILFSSNLKLQTSNFKLQTSNFKRYKLYVTFTFNPADMALNLSVVSTMLLYFRQPETLWSYSTTGFLRPMAPVLLRLFSP